MKLKQQAKILKAHSLETLSFLLSVKTIVQWNVVQYFNIFMAKYLIELFIHFDQGHMLFLFNNFFCVCFSSLVWVYYYYYYFFFCPIVLLPVHYQPLVLYVAEEPSIIFLGLFQSTSLTPTWLSLWAWYWDRLQVRCRVAQIE